nr:hypothetical protein [Tanacetum cinerariifolium]
MFRSHNNESNIATGALSSSTSPTRITVCLYMVNVTSLGIAKKQVKYLQDLKLLRTFKFHLKCSEYVDAKDRPTGTNDEESEYRHKPGALMNLVVNAAFVRWSNERPLENKELNAIIGAWMLDVNSATSRYLSTDFIVSDEKGNLMHCTARGNIAYNFLRLKEGAIYSVRNFTVQPNKDNFRVLRFAHFIIEMDEDTIVRWPAVKPNGFARYPFQLVEFDSLEPTNNIYLIGRALNRTTTTSKQRPVRESNAVRLQNEEETTLPPTLANIVGTLHTLELKSNSYYEHKNYRSFTYWRVVLEEALDESGSSGTLAVIGEPKAGVLVPLTITPSVKERHDSDGEESFVADSKIKGSDVGCSFRTGKRRRFMLDGSE